MRRLLAPLLAAALIVPQLAQAADDAPPATPEANVLPAWTGAYQPQTSDERGLWAEDDERERILRESDRVVRDGPLNDYVRSVLCRAVGQDRCGAARIYIVRAPLFNASMTPNGTMRGFTGLLLRVRDEAELASVLGHEFAHFEQRHGLASYRAARSGTDLAAWTAVFGAVALVFTSAAYASNGTNLAIYGDIYRFQRAQESEADRLGFTFMASSGYRPRSAGDVWRAVMDEADQTALDRGRRLQRYDNTAFFASHPTSLDRATALDALADATTGGDYTGADRHRAAIAPHMATFLADELALNDFGGTDYVLRRLAETAPSASVEYARGELYRKRGAPRDLASATAFYRAALDLDPTLSAAWRGLGLAQMRSGNTIEGAAALRTFLEANPDATDAAMLLMMIGEQ